MPTKDKEKIKATRRKNYEKNKQHIVEKTQRNRKEKSNWLREYKSTLSCVRCGQDHPATLDFHHRDPSEKEVLISKITLKGWSIERMMIEINKCDVLCANCHRILHYDENMSV